MEYGINTWASDGSIQFEPNYAPYNFMDVIFIPSTSGNGSKSFTVPSGRELNAFPDRTAQLGGFLVSVSGNTVNWTRYGSDLVDTWIYVTTRAV